MIMGARVKAGWITEEDLIARPNEETEEGEAPRQTPRKLPQPNAAAGQILPPAPAEAEGTPEGGITLPMTSEQSTANVKDA